MIALGLIMLVLCLAGIVASVWLGLPGWRDYWQAHKEDKQLPEVIVHDHIQAIREDKLRQDIEELYRKVHYRHNVHCPRCGRFSRLTEGLADCTVHGIQVMTVPIEIVPVTASTLGIEIPPITASLVVVEVVEIPPDTIAIELPLADLIKSS